MPGFGTLQIDRIVVKTAAESGTHKSRQCGEERISLSLSPARVRHLLQKVERAPLKTNRRSLAQPVSPQSKVRATPGMEKSFAPEKLGPQAVLRELVGGGERLMGNTLPLP